MRIQRPGQKILTIGNPGLQIISPRGGAAWTPASISGLFLWLDFNDADTLFTDNGSTKVSSSGDLIYQANDKSGNGNNALQTNAIYRPTYVEGSIGSTSMYLSSYYSDKLLVAHDETLNITSSISVFIVAKLATANVQQIVSKRSTWDSTGIPYEVGWDNGAGAVEARVIGNINEASLTGLSGLLAAIWNGSRLTPYLNGVEKTPINTSGTIVNNTVGVGIGALPGGNEPMINGSLLGEIALYNTALSDGDRQNLETYLNNKWNIW